MKNYLYLGVRSKISILKKISSAVMMNERLILIELILKKICNADSSLLEILD